MTQQKPDKPPNMRTDASETSNRSGLNREIQTKIGQKLRAMYDEIVQEGVPERFTDLLRHLDKENDDGKRE